MNTTTLPQPIYELVQTLLDVRNTLEDVRLEANTLIGLYGDAPIISLAAQTSLDAINQALDLIQYNN